MEKTEMRPRTAAMKPLPCAEREKKKTKPKLRKPFSRVKCLFRS